MKLALVAVLFAFVAPAPVAESALGVEDEIVLESSRGLKSSSLRAAFRKLLRQERACPAPRPSLRDVEVALPLRTSSGWQPRLFSRPPPLA